MMDGRKRIPAGYHAPCDAKAPEPESGDANRPEYSMEQGLSFE